MGSGDAHCVMICPEGVVQYAGNAQGDVWKPTICVNGQPAFGLVGSFGYLGSAFHEDGGLDGELNRRIQLAALAFRKLQHPFFQQRCVTLRVRIHAWSTRFCHTRFMQQFMPTVPHTSCRHIDLACISTFLDFTYCVVSLAPHNGGP